VLGDPFLDDEDDASAEEMLAALERREKPQ
jgi:hypothetical protein